MLEQSYQGHTKKGLTTHTGRAILKNNNRIGKRLRKGKYAAYGSAESPWVVERGVPSMAEDGLGAARRTGVSRVDRAGRARDSA